MMTYEKKSFILVPDFRSFNSMDPLLYAPPPPGEVLDGNGVNSS